MTCLRRQHYINQSRKRTLLTAIPAVLSHREAGERFPWMDVAVLDRLTQRAGVILMSLPLAIIVAREKNGNLARRIRVTGYALRRLLISSRYLVALSVSFTSLSREAATAESSHCSSRSSSLTGARRKFN
jgi:hypothetical protein